MYLFLHVMVHAVSVPLCHIGPLPVQRARRIVPGRQETKCSSSAWMTGLLVSYHGWRAPRLTNGPDASRLPEPQESSSKDSVLSCVRLVSVNDSSVTARAERACDKWWWHFVFDAAKQEGIKMLNFLVLFKSLFCEITKTKNNRTKTNLYPAAQV